jgi:dienelactone hydrolase
MSVAGICCRFALGALVLSPASGPSAADRYEEVFYKSGDLKIQAYLYRPRGAGPFPVVIYNHGSRVGRERQRDPCEYIGRSLTEAGFAVFVPERRGYGDSDGTTFSQEAGDEGGPRFIQRVRSETEDVLAAIPYLKTVSSVDVDRMGIMGWSLGGIITMVAIGRSRDFRAAVDQAGGALTWRRSGRLRDELLEAADDTRTPVLLMVARNDRTTDSVTTLAARLKARNAPHKLVIYDNFVSARSGVRTGAGAGAGGHAIFGREGISIWLHEVVDFLTDHLNHTR